MKHGVQSGCFLGMQIRYTFLICFLEAGLFESPSWLGIYWSACLDLLHSEIVGVHHYSLLIS